MPEYPQTEQAETCKKDGNAAKTLADSCGGQEDLDTELKITFTAPHKQHDRLH